MADPVARPPAGAAADLLAALGRGCALAGVNLANVLRGNFRAAAALDHFYLMGARSALLVGLAGLFIGMVLTLQVANELKTLDLMRYAADVNCVAILRELGPLLTALLLAGRAGSGIAAELAAMHTTEQIRAMRMLGLDVGRHLVAPRLVGCILAAFSLTVVFDILALAGGYLVAVFDFNMTFYEFHSDLTRVLDGGDLTIGLIKAALFGFIVAVVGCYNGLGATGGSRGVGRATRRSVVTASFLIIMSDFFVTKFLLVAFGKMT